MTLPEARNLAEQVLGKYAHVVTLAMREDVARLVLHVEAETMKKTEPPRPALVRGIEVTEKT
jgi:hypothetical protein